MTCRPIVWAVCALTCCAGCASLTHGTKQTVDIESQPPGAKVTILPEQIKVTTPAEVALSRGLTHTVQIEQEGYERQTVYIDRHASDAAKGNILIGGLIGICIDLSDGAAFDLVPQDINVQLQPTAQVATSPPQSSEIVDKPTVLPTGSSP